MELRERLEFCKICTHRKMDMRQGLLCGLTNAKADFEEGCSQLEIDEKRKSEIEAQKKELLESEDYQIGGWLAFFLWVGIGASAIMSVVTLICSWGSLIYSPCILGANVVLTLCILYVAILAIIAFYQRKNYAVPLANIWVILNGLSSIFGLIYATVFGVNPEILVDAIRGIVWVVIWGSFIAYSERIKNIIPKPYHKRKVDISVLGVYIVALLLAFIGIADVAIHPMSSKFISTRYMINTMNEARPITSNYGITELPVYKEGKILVVPMRIENTKTSDLLEHQKLGLQLFIKHDILGAAAETPYTFFFLRGNTLRIMAKDMNDADSFSFEITPKEYKDAVNMGDDYRVPQEDIDKLVQAYLDILPYPFSDGQLIDIRNDQKELRYIIEIPDVTYDDMTQQIGYSYLRNFIYDNWSSIQDILVLLNEKNHKDITYAFKGIDSNKTLDVTIKYPYVVY